MAATLTPCQTDSELARLQAALSAHLLAHCALADLLVRYRREAVDPAACQNEVVARLLGIGALSDVLARDRGELMRLEAHHGQSVRHLHPTTHPRCLATSPDKCGA